MTQLVAQEAVAGTPEGRVAQELELVHVQVGQHADGDDALDVKVVACTNSISFDKYESRHIITETPEIGRSGKMQTNTNLDRTGLGKLIVSIFESGNPEVYLRNTDEGENTGDFVSARDVNAFIDAAIEANRQFVGFTIWYPDTRGYVEKRKVVRETQKGAEHVVRHVIRGWGIIILQLNFEKLPLINCCVSCNSQKKAENWFDSHPHLKNPDLWDWEAVVRHCKRLMRFAEGVSLGHPVEGSLSGKKAHPVTKK